MYVSALKRHRLECAAIKTIFCLTFVACGTTPQQPKKQTELNLEQLRISCEEVGNAQDCAKYGYHARSLEHTKKACGLGDDNSCFNVMEIENKIPNQNFAIIGSQQQLIFGCYVNHSIDMDNGEQEKKDKVVNFFFDIDTMGKIANITIDGEVLSDKFKKCVTDGFTSKKFMALDRNQIIRYDFVMPAVTTDRRLKNNPNPNKLLE